MRVSSSASITGTVSAKISYWNSSTQVALSTPVSAGSQPSERSVASSRLRGSACHTVNAASSR
jgi:hypothetical protein